METPSSTTRRLTRSQALMNNIPMSRKVEDFDNSFSKSRQRITALTDITNDSPIIGLAMAKLETPSSAMSKNLRNSETRTPGSGEALLRGQVKTLLQKVEEEAEYSKFSLEKKQFLYFQGFLNSPTALLALAPTPANTPQIENVLGTTAFKNACLAAVTPSPVQEQLMISQMVVNGTVNGVKQDGSESDENVINRSLFFDFSDKSDSTTDSSSVWSLQVNTSAKDDEEQEFEGDIENEDYDYENEEYDYENEDDDGGLVDELCEGINRISVNGATKFAGKHTKFIYNSDGEIEVEECGFQTPREKHLEVDEDTEC